MALLFLSSTTKTLYDDLAKLKTIGKVGIIFQLCFLVCISYRHKNYRGSCLEAECVVLGVLSNDIDNCQMKMNF